jgi:hypothetical protein
MCEPDWIFREVPEVAIQSLVSERLKIDPFPRFDERARDPHS